MGREVLVGSFTGLEQTYGPTATGPINYHRGLHNIVLSLVEKKKNG